MGNVTSCDFLHVRRAIAVEFRKKFMLMLSNALVQESSRVVSPLHVSASNVALMHTIVFVALRITSFVSSMTPTIIEI